DYVAKTVARNLPPSQLRQRAEVISLAGSAGRAPSAAIATDLSDGLFFLAPACCSPLPPGPLLLIPSCPPLAPHRLCDCRGTAARRLLDYLQPQLACLPPQRLDLLVLHPGLVLLLTLARVRQAVLQRQVDDPGQLVRRRGHGRLRPQPPFHPPQEPAQ